MWIQFHFQIHYVELQEHCQQINEMETGTNSGDHRAYETDANVEVKVNQGG